MIGVNDIVPRFLAACPGLTLAWNEHLEYWGDQDRGCYNDVSVISSYLVDCYERGEVKEFAAAFDSLEQCIVDGDEKTQELAIIGIIEGIQNSASHRPFGYRVFTPWLGPQSRRAWDELIAAWEGVGNLADMVRKEKGAPATESQPVDWEAIRDPELRRIFDGFYRKP
jgi:hypothetical protein